MTPPIPLQDIFARCHVKNVVFQPLLVDAALAVDDDGFVVFVNCDESCREVYKSAFDSPGQKGRYLPGRVRFSLAHELVHTFFYDTKTQPYAHKLTGTHAREIESLESACNFGASHLLLPSRSLKLATHKRDILSVDDVTDLANRYQVSIECLITRLEHLEDWTPKRGLVALVRQIEDEFRVKAVAKSAAVRGLFENVRVGAGLETAFRRVSFKEIEDRRNGTLDFDVTYPRGVSFGAARCQMEYRWIGGGSQAFVLAVLVDDRPRSTIAKKDPNDADSRIAKLKEAMQRSAPAQQGHASYKSIRLPIRESSVPAFRARRR